VKKRRTENATRAHRRAARHETHVLSPLSHPDTHTKHTADTWASYQRFWRGCGSIRRGCERFGGGGWVGLETVSVVGLGLDAAVDRVRRRLGPDSILRALHCLVLCAVGVEDGAGGGVFPLEVVVGLDSPHCPRPRAPERGCRGPGVPAVLTAVCPRARARPSSRRRWGGGRGSGRGPPAHPSAPGTAAPTRHGLPRPCRRAGTPPSAAAMRARRPRSAASPSVSGLYAGRRRRRLAGLRRGGGEDGGGLKTVFPSPLLDADSPRVRVQTVREDWPRPPAACAAGHHQSPSPSHARLP
jgi:hypothetical protein